MPAIYAAPCLADHVRFLLSLRLCLILRPRRFASALCLLALRVSALHLSHFFRPNGRDLPHPHFIPYFFPPQNKCDWQKYQEQYYTRGEDKRKFLSHNNTDFLTLIIPSADTVRQDMPISLRWNGAAR